MPQCRCGTIVRNATQCQECRLEERDNEEYDYGYGWALDNPEEPEEVDDADA